MNPQESYVILLIDTTFVKLIITMQIYMLSIITDWYFLA